MHPHDSSVDSPWVVPAMPTSRRSMPAVIHRQPAPFKVTLSTVAAAAIAILAVGVMVAGILFVRSDDGSDSITTASAPTQAMNLPAVSPAREALPSAPPVIVVGDAPLPPLTITAAEPAAPAMATAPAAAVAVAKPVMPVVAPTVVAAKPTAVVPVARPVAAAPIAAAPRAATAKKGDKSVEDILNELGEEQLRR